MMATESRSGRSDEATATSEPEPAIKIDTYSHDADRPHLNGEAAGSAATDDIGHKHISDIVDDLVNSTEVSISGGSDNEASKGDASKSKDGDKGHGRTSSSVKKPASFKSISVNKTFLTTKGAVSSTPAKVGDKLAPTISATTTPSGSLAVSRPRLVAKSGSGLVAKSSGANGGKPGSAPDPNAVWNKNRPVPPPQPKNYTDEELKKYGIHMANRLQSDDTKGGQANWADIDDDDEDWAPETITWKDGTQITIPHTEEQAPAPAPEPAPVRAPVSAPAPNPTIAPRQTAKENGILEKAKPPAPPAPVIKPGVLASGKGLVLKGVQDKPTLVAKPPAPPTPAKSPWAPIPKVDNASPIIPDFPNHAPSRIPPKDAPISNSITPPPPKEIAADDFSRAPWRDGAQNRELFNSQSGRYEPVPDRRGSLRPEPQHGRQPALLQRSSNHDQPGPADYSGPFQGGRPNDQPLPYNRRRGSSNVSGGSGSYMHRLKTHDQPPLPPPELINARRGSFTGRSDSPASPRNYSPSGIQSGPRHAWPSKTSPAMSHASPYSQHAQPVPPAAQPQLVPVVTEDEVELQKRIMRERRELAMKRRLEEEAKEEAAKKERIRLKLEAMGPAPESNSAKKAATKDQATTPTQIQPREGAASEQAIDEKKPSEQAPTLSVRTESNKTDSMPNGASSSALPSPASIEARPQPQGSTHAHPWPPAPANPPKQTDRYGGATWGPQPAAAKNVWGAPNNNRSLGNGTFSADLGTTQVPQLPSKTGPGPIARPSQTSSATTVPARQPPIGPPKQAPAQDRQSKQSAWASAVRLNDDAFNQMLNAQYEERDRRLAQEGRALADIQPTIKETWRPTNVDEGTGLRNENAAKQSLQRGPEKSWVTSSESTAAPSQRVSSVASAAPSEYSQRTQGTAPVHDAASASILGPNNAAPHPTRGSRFFPSHREQPQEPHRERQEAHPEISRPKSPSPPPPDMAGHPAFDGDVAHPHVSLPRPAVVVRLPPTIPTEPRAAAPEITNSRHAPPATSPGPSFAWASQAAYQHDVPPTGPSSTHPGHPTSEWQAKFDSLLGGRKPHPTPRSPGADSTAHHGFTRVFSSSSGIDGSVTSKVRDEECFEEQEMGSLPPVRLPSDVSQYAWQPSPPPKPLPKKFLANVASAEAITFPLDMSGSGTVWRVAFPGFAKNIVVPYGRTRSNPRRGGGGQRGGGRHPPSGPNPRGKGRDGPSTYSNDQSSGPSSSNPPPSRGNRGGYRGAREGGWSRSAAIQT